MTVRYWEKIGLKKTQWEGFLQTIPYEPQSVYRIADEFGVSPADIPCLVFFPSLSSKELVVNRLGGTWTEEQLTKHLRNVFSVIRDTREGDAIWRKLREYVTKEERASKRETRYVATATSVADIIATILAVLRQFKG